MTFIKSGLRGILPATLLLAALVATTEVAYAQATASANASAYVAAPITITKMSDLSFGAFVAGTGGTITLVPGGSKDQTGVVTLTSGAQTPTYAVFSVTGTPNFVYSVTLPTTVTLTGPSSSNLTISLFTSNPTSPVTLSAGGTSTLGIGATLTIPANQVSGSFTSSFSVTVSYQ